MRRRRQSRDRRAGVTLLEVLIVMAIMALIVGLAAPRLTDSFGRAKSQAAEIQIANLASALQLFYVDAGRYPSTAEGLDALLRAPQGLNGWRGPYLDAQEDIIDPWGRRYEYGGSTDTIPFELSSLGRDGQRGGTGEDSDIVR